MHEEKQVFCPLCGTMVFKTIARMIAVSGTCKKCNKIVTYDGELEKTKVSDIPMRKTSSGKSFF